MKSSIQILTISFKTPSKYLRPVKTISSFPLSTVVVALPYSIVVALRFPSTPQPLPSFHPSHSGICILQLLIRHGVRTDCMPTSIDRSCYRLACCRSCYGTSHLCYFASDISCYHVNMALMLYASTTLCAPHALCCS